MKIAAAHSYSAVPFMFTVAPSGRTKLDTLFETPILSSTDSIVTGSVADEDAVENAVSIAGDAPLIVFTGSTRPMNRSNSGSVTNAWIASARTTDAEKSSKGLAAPNPVSAITLPTSPNTPIGANSMMNSVIFIMTWNTAFQKLNSGSAY